MRRLRFAAFVALAAVALPTSAALAQGRDRERATETAVEREFKFTIVVPELPSAQCSATSTTQYEQRNTVARIKATVSVSDCTMASGTFTVAVLTRDESGTAKPLEFSETWQRSNDQAVQLTADYPIGDNSELVNVRLRGLTCTCADNAKEAGEQAATQQPPPEPTDAAP